MRAPFATWKSIGLLCLSVLAAHAEKQEIKLNATYSLAYPVSVTTLRGAKSVNKLLKGGKKVSLTVIDAPPSEKFFWAKKNEDQLYAVQIKPPVDKKNPKEVWYVDKGDLAVSVYPIKVSEKLQQTKEAISKLSPKEPECEPLVLVPPATQPAATQPTTQASELKIPAWDKDWTFEASKKFIQDTPLDTSLLDVIERSEWDSAWAKKQPKNPKLGPKAPQGSYASLGTPTEIVIHHSAGTKEQTPESILKEHLNRKDPTTNTPWIDVGYHYIIGKDALGKWKIFEGRPVDKVGAHAGPNKNKGKIGIVILGNYENVSADNPGGVSTTAAEFEKQAEPEAVYLALLLSKHLQEQNSTLTSLNTHGLRLHADHDATCTYRDKKTSRCQHAANPGHTQCPGENCLHLVSAMKERLGL